MSKLCVSIITRNRSEDLQLTISSLLDQRLRIDQIIVLENGSDAAVKAANASFFAQIPEITYCVSDTNMGVAGGRNHNLDLVETDFVVEIDDDIEFTDSNCLMEALSFMEDNSDIACAAFRITNFFTKTQTHKEFPFRDKKRNPAEAGECFWFIGAGHIFRTEAIRLIGGYRDFFPYGSEEQDLSVRLLDAGKRLYYLPKAHILHKASPVARPNDDIEFGALLLGHRLKFCLMNFPYLFCITAFIIRGLQFALRYRSFLVIFFAMRNLFRSRRYILANRKVVSRNTMLKLLNRNSQLLF